MPEVVTEDELSKLEDRMRDDDDAVRTQKDDDPQKRAFSPGEYASRLSKLRTAMEKAKVDVVLLSSPEAQCWLHGYQARWYRIGSTTKWAPCNFTAIHVTEAAVIRAPYSGDLTKGAYGPDHTIFQNPTKAKPVIDISDALEFPGELRLELTDDFLLFDSSDHKDLIQFTSIAEGFCHFDDPSHPEKAKPDMESVHKFLLGELEHQGWLTEGAVIGIEEWSPRQNAATTADLSKQIAGLSASTKISAKPQDITALVRNLQSIKSDEELDVMKEAGKILSNAYDHLLSENLHVSRRNIRGSGAPYQRVDPPRTMRLHPGMTEMQVWAEMEWAMAQQGGETAGLHNTVSRTRRYCHALSSTRIIGTGPLLLDPCGVKHRYHVNAARQFYLGKEVPPELAKASRIAAGAMEVLRGVARSGVTFWEVSKALQEYYKSRGVWDLRDWIGGYQFGIAFTPDWVGEFIWDADLDALKEDKGRVIEENLVASFESFVGGAGFIDTVVFKASGIEVLCDYERVIQPIVNDIPDWWKPATTS